MRIKRTKKSINSLEETSFIQTYSALGFDSLGTVGNEKYGDCPFCGSKGKFYVNEDSGLFSCKVCGEEGNLTTFMNKYHKQIRKEYKIGGKRAEALAVSREIPASILIEAGLYFDGERYGFPVRNQNGNIVNFRRFRLAPKLKVIGLPGVGAWLWGIDQIKPLTKKVLIFEGEWDCLAFRQFLIEQGFEDEFRSGEWVAISVPGAGIWKSDWYKFIEGKDVVLCYDNDGPGQRGMARTFEALGGGDKFAKRKLQVVNWPDGLPSGFDFRDFYKSEGDWDTFQEMLGSKIDSSPAGQGISSEEIEKPRPDGDRPSYKEVIEAFEKWLLMTPQHEDVLKIIFAVVLSNNLPGDPLWLHIVGSPGSGKTELLMSTAACPDVVVRSSITAKSLVSGHAGGNDPSLLPKLFGKTFILKDFTEVLQMPRTDREQVYSILRGAYDGSLERSYGNGAVREYNGYFSMIAGVTHSIDGDSDASMGDRFLKYRMAEQDEKSRRELIMESLRNVGKETTMKEELQDICARFLTIEVDFSSIPEVPQDIMVKLAALAELVSVLRATVERDTYNRERIKFRPQSEIGTRIAKQLKRLLLGLSLVHDPPRILEKDYELVTAVAGHTCTPFHLEIIRHLIDNSDQKIDDVSKALNIPLTTLRECFDNMHLLGILEKFQEEGSRTGLIGRRPWLWSVTEDVKIKWRQAGL